LLPAETCDGTAIPSELEAEFCDAHCVTGTTDLTFGCRSTCNSTCSGLLHYALGADQSTLKEFTVKKEEVGGFIGRLESWFHEHF
jgi:hypothetical protein